MVRNISGRGTAGDDRHPSSTPDALPVGIGRRGNF
jgi:hypothetical protein